MDNRNLIPSHPYYSYYGWNHNFYFHNPGEYNIVMRVTQSNHPSQVNLSTQGPAVCSTPTAIMMTPSRSGGSGPHVEVPRVNYPILSQGSPILSGHIRNSDFCQSSGISTVSISDTSAPVFSSTLCANGIAGCHSSGTSFEPQSESSSTSAFPTSSMSSATSYPPVFSSTLCTTGIAGRHSSDPTFEPQSESSSTSAFPTTSMSSATS